MLEAGRLLASQAFPRPGDDGLVDGLAIGARVCVCVSVCNLHRCQAADHFLLRGSCWSIYECCLACYVITLQHLSSPLQVNNQGALWRQRISGESGPSLSFFVVL
jgi:hypothetical protein